MSKLTIKILVSLLLTLTYFTPCSSVSIVIFEHVNAGWVKGIFSHNFGSLTVSYYHFFVKFHNFFELLSTSTS